MSEFGDSYYYCRNCPCRVWAFGTNRSNLFTREEITGNVDDPVYKLCKRCSAMYSQRAAYGKRVDVAARRFYAAVAKGLI